MGGDEATSVFAGDPQPVDVHHRGIWYPGEMLGWRFDESGRCLARVRCVVDGLRHSTWKQLAELRLPEPTPPPAVQAAEAAQAGRTAPPADLPAGIPTLPDPPAAPVERPAGIPAAAAAPVIPPVAWGTVGRHETAAPVRDSAHAGRHETAAPVRVSADAGRHARSEDDTLPHALLVDRARRRPAVPRPAPVPRTSAVPSGVGID